MKLFRKQKRKRASSVTAHYLEHKEAARCLVTNLVKHWNQFYGFEYNRIAIRNQRRCWGSCSSLKNLNFNYRILFLPPHLQDYIVVHELCHLEELNHGKEFWNLIQRQIPHYEDYIKELKYIENTI